MAVRIRTDSRTAESGGCAGQFAHWWAGPAATEFLQRMQRWQAGVTTVRRCVPRLLRAMRAQGWPRLTEMDDAHRVLLEADILKNTGGALLPQPPTTSDAASSAEESAIRRSISTSVAMKRSIESPRSQSITASTCVSRLATVL